MSKDVFIVVSSATIKEFAVSGKPTKARVSSYRERQDTCQAESEGDEATIEANEVAHTVEAVVAATAETVGHIADVVRVSSKAPNPHSKVIAKIKVNLLYLSQEEHRNNHVTEGINNNNNNNPMTWALNKTTDKINPLTWVLSVTSQRKTNKGYR